MSSANRTPEYVYTTDISQFIDYSVPQLEEAAPIQEAIAAIGRSPGGAVLLHKPNSRQLGGIITVSDLAKLEKFGPQDWIHKQAKDLATTSGVIGIKYDAKLWELLRLINGVNSRKRPLDQVPVVDADKQIIGLIDRESLNRRMVELEYGPASMIVS